MDKNRIIQWEEILENSNEKSCYIIINDKVYNVSQQLTSIQSQLQSEQNNNNDEQQQQQQIQNVDAQEKQNNIDQFQKIKELLISNIGILNCQENIKQKNIELYNEIIKSNNIVGTITKQPQNEQIKRNLRFIKAEYTYYTIQEVQKHNKKQDLWVILDNNRVYDLTEYQFIHPGRPDVIHPYAGTNATDYFNSINKHTSGARKFKENYFIGRINLQENSI